MKKKEKEIKKESKPTLSSYCEGVRPVALNTFHTEARFFHAGVTDDRFRDDF